MASATGGNDDGIQKSVPDVEMWWFQDPELKDGFEALNKDEIDKLLEFVKAKGGKQDTVNKLLNYAALTNKVKAA